MYPQSVRETSLVALFVIGILVSIDGCVGRELYASTLRDDATSSLSVELSVFLDKIKRRAAKMKVVLLDADPEIILRDAGLEAMPGQDLTGTYQFAASGSISPRLKKFRAAVEKAMKPHIIATAVTDSQGKAYFTGLKPGTTYLRGTAKFDRGRSFVNSQFELKPGENTLVL